MTKEVLESIKNSIQESKKNEKSIRLVNMMYQNIWNIILLNYECCSKKKQFSLYLEDELLNFMLLVNENEYNTLINNLKKDGFIFTYISNKDRTLITITKEQIIKIVDQNMTTINTKSK